MAHHYALRQFLRQAPNDLLALYFHDRELLRDLDVASLKQGDIEPIVAALESLDQQQLAQVHADFQQIDCVANDNGIGTILQEGRDFHHVDLEPPFADMPGSYDKALYTFLHHLRCLEISAQLCSADSLPQNICFNRRENVPAWPPRDDQATRDELALEIGSYFKRTEGRGGACHVDVYRRGGRFYFFCYPEDYGSTAMEYEGSALRRRAHRPVFEVLFVYAPEEEALDTYFQGKRAVRQELEGIFGQVILRCDLGKCRDDRVYELNPLRDRSFRFTYPPASGISDVRIREMRFAVLDRKNRKIVLSADADRPEAIYELIDEVFDTPNRPASPGAKIPLSLTNVTRVKLTAYFPVQGKRAQARTFYVTFPNSCTLRPDGRDGLLHEMLIVSGIERANTPEPDA